MVQSVVKGVVAVVSTIEESQQTDFNEFNFEFQAGSNWITDAFESCKRQIISSNGLEPEESRKRRKAGSISDYKSDSSKDKENSHPNMLYESNQNCNQQQENDVVKEVNDSNHNIDIMSLRVAELRKHLQQRRLDTSGLKKTLQMRLQNAIDEENQNGIEATSENVREDEFHAGEVQQEELSNKQKSDENKDESADSIEKDEEAKDAMNIEQSSDINIDVKEVIAETNCELEKNSMEEECDEDAEMVEARNEIIEAQGRTSIKVETEESTLPVESDGKQSHSKSLGKQILKATMKVFSPNIGKISKKSKKEGNNTDIASNMNNMNLSDNVVHYESKAREANKSEVAQSTQEEEPKPTQSTRGSMSCKLSSEEIKPSQSKISNESIPEQKSSSEGATFQTLVQATPSLHSKKATDVLMTSSKKLQSMKEARKIRLDEIRNKVKPKTMPQHSNNKNAMSSAVSHQKTKAPDAADRKRVIANQMRQKAAATKPTGSFHQEKETIKPVAPKHLKKPLSPMDTYEMSDRGESDSDESEEEDRESKKKIPKWALREFLRPALERQFLDGPHKIDPDEIFPEVSSCDLEAIFDQRKKRYIKRTSSGNWTQDKVTVHEKLVYKRKMGFNKK